MQLQLHGGLRVEMKEQLRVKWATNHVCLQPPQKVYAGKSPVDLYILDSPGGFLSCLVRSRLISKSRVDLELSVSVILLGFYTIVDSVRSRLVDSFQSTPHPRTPGLAEFQVFGQE